MCETKIGIIVTGHISAAVVYNDAGEVVRRVVLKLQGAAKINRSQDFCILARIYV